MLEKYLIGNEVEGTAALKYDTRNYRITLGGRRKFAGLFRSLAESLAGKGRVQENLDVGGRLLLTFRITPKVFRLRIKKLRRFYSVATIHNLGRMLH